MILHRPDGARFGPWGGARSERCRCIVIDEQRSHGPNLARPGGVVLRDFVDSVAALAGATSPCCAPRLATKSRRTIRVVQYHVIML